MEEYEFTVPRFLKSTEIDCQIYDVDNFITKAKNNFNDIKFTNGINTDSFRKYFRGQSNAHHGLKTSIVRHMEHELKSKNDKKSINKAMETKEDKIFDLAERMGIGRNTTDLEKLAILQHHGIPTRLLDITDEALVALYFACSGNPEKDGRIFVFLVDPESESGEEIHIGKNRNKPSEQSSRSHTATVGEIKAIRTESPKLVRPDTIDPRIIAQSGLFITGNVTSAGYQYYPDGAKMKDSNQKTQHTNLRVDEAIQVTPFKIFFATQKTLKKEHNIYCKTILIPKNLKSKILKELNELGINKKSLFPDFNTMFKLATEYKDLVK